MDSKHDMFHNSPKIQRRIISKNNFTYRNIIEIIEGVIGSKQLNILDFGCGVGTLDFYLASKGHSVRGVDVSTTAVRVGRESAKAMKLDSRVTFGYLKQKLSRKFDLIICSEVIEHVSDDNRLLKYLVGLLVQNGILIISTPLKTAPLFKFGFTKRFDQSVGHLRRYNEEQLVRMFQLCGLKVVSVKKNEGLLRNSLFIFRRINFLVRFVRGPLSDLVTFVDKISLHLLGASDISVVGKRI